MTVNSYKFRLYPTKTQKQRLNGALETCRTLYNEFIFESRLAYKEGYKIRSDELQRIIPEMIPKEKPVYSKVAQMVLQQFYKNIFRLHAISKNGNKIGNLRYKSKNQFNVINYNQSGFRFLDNKTLKLSKVGKLRINIHRPICGVIKEIHVKKEVNFWFACIVTESEFVTSCSLSRKKIIGIDVGIKNFIYDSDGKVVLNPKFLEKSEKKLKRAQRKFSQKLMGSNNNSKQKLKLVKIHTKIKNKRNDFLHKLSRYYVDKYDTIFVEDLHIKNLQKNHCIAKSLSDSAWNSFFQKLEYKAERAGILFRKITAAGTSQECSSCGKKVEKTLAIRTHACPYCGLVIDRDYNAAINIKQKGLDSLPMGCREVTPVEIVPLLVMRCDKQGLSLNQETRDSSIG